MKLFRNIIELSATIFENFIILDFLIKLFGYKFTGIKNSIYFYIVLIISTVYVTVLNTFMLFEGWYVLITIGVFIFYGLICLNGKAFKKILMPIICFTVIICINISTTYLLSFLLREKPIELMSTESTMRIFSLFITKFLFLIVTRAILYLFKKDELDLKKSEIILISISFILSNSIFISNIEIQFGKNPEILNLISAMAIIIINIFIFIMFKRISSENKNKLRISVLETQLSEQRAMIQDAGHLSKEIKKAEHDIKHHFLSLLGLLEENNCKEATVYIRNLLGEYETSIFKYITIENSAVNSILNFKISRCHVEHIDIKLEVESAFSEFDNIDICVLISNLLDNAIEACVGITFPQIILTIREEKNYLCILVKNKIERSVLENNGDLKTTKDNKHNHGLGLYSVSQIVDKYDGLKKFYERNGFFIANIWLKKLHVDHTKHVQLEKNCQTRQN